ncbi:RNA helicase [Flavobacterium psychrophilum]|uniref:ATP-dependent RNA helicase, DEAD box family n=2 Tax=Flavobacterium psychrophilum TaxID=96345 RepID=A6GXE7_FLAPJ|nr:DEAD/DEAH box helicase [Flavobacterium psychrophilum]AIG29565.1 RNA helicase [Flavobacterium psychrophilum]AIG31842.1 RNA helicase [Flavobacterium psychrophilum]AIG33996.1 RNA helicase [Flavobacterium psychrophilum]AIG36359.1 RNA helicase [Flavobacterium psychrophilum]AIG38625.1 RNA helicase [Flavobacterium psychrophilum]
MKLKKINENLQQALIENGLTQANELQKETFSTIKSGADAVIAAPKGAGKSTTIILNVIQRMEKSFGESTRALIIVENKERVLEMENMFLKYGKYHDLSVFGVHEKGDVDYDKNVISMGLDVLIGTPNRINAMFSSAGFNISTVKMFVVDDCDILFRNRMDAVVDRLSNSIDKTQRLFFTTDLTERVESLADKIMIEPLFFEMEDQENNEEEENIEQQ